MADIVGRVMGFICPVTIPPIKRQFEYLCCFNSNIESLRDEARKLNNARVGLQMRVATAKNNAEVILPEVEEWLNSANTEIEVNLTEIESEIPNLQRGFFSIKSRFSLSKKARKTTEAMEELRERCDFSCISEAIPPPARVSIPLGPTFYDFESRKQIEEDIMEALRGKEVKIMGICGMGGIGKTMMAKKIMKTVKEEHLFDEAVISVVSQHVEKQKIQLEIAESLGLILEVETITARAHYLHARLLQGKKRTLIVLDDIWEKLELEELGLTPRKSGVEGDCTILLTSRDKGVLNAMEAQRVFAFHTLSEIEAWCLFREKVGNCVDDLNLLSTAKQVANECKGLPLALITLGSALKDKNAKPIWEDALHQLKDSNPIDLSNVLKHVYNPLKLSYDFLDSEHAKYLFLLCCLFPEDSNIGLEHLARYCMGLRMFGEIRNLERVRNKVYALVDMLKNHFLLLDGYDNDYVRMHDVVRDVANYIASKEPFIDLNLQTMNWLSGQYSSGDFKWFSLFSKNDLFLVHGPGWKNLEIKNFHFFEGMKGLNVLSLESISLNSLTQNIQLLKNLRTLHLENCNLESISVVGGLLSLEILRCDHCDNIEELPVEIGNLNQLKLLDFSYCKNLKTIESGVMSNLVSLEELIMIASFARWGLAKVSEEEGRNASLNDLQSLSNLRLLQIEVADYTLLSQEIHFCSKIEKIFIGSGVDSRPNYALGNFKNEIALGLPREIALGNWVQNFLGDTKRLSVEGDGSNSLDLLRVQNVKSLILKSCSTIRNLVNTATSIHWRRFGVFPLLEYMWLWDLSNLEGICQGPIPDESNSFKNLRAIIVSQLPALRTLWKSPDQNISLGNLSSVDIQGCNQLLYLFPLTTAKSLLQLEKLIIFKCEMMRELFSNDESRTKGHITFPKLKRLSPNILPNLTKFCEGIESIDFPELTDMEIAGCPKLMSYVSFSMNYDNSRDGHDDDDDANEDSFNLFYNQKVSFPILERLALSNVRNLEQLCDSPIAEGSDYFKNIKELIIDCWPELKYLWKSRNVSHNINNCDKKDGLLQIEELGIWKCEMLEQLFLNEEKEYCHKHHLTFPKLKTLSLFSLPNLTTLFEGIDIIDFPVLNHVSIRGCPKLTSIVSPIGANGHDDLFCCQKVKFGKLKELSVQGCSNISNMWCQQILDSFFVELKSLEIVECDGIRSLFSYTIARNLVNLEDLTIERCKEMVKVIDDDEEVIKETNCPLLSLFPRLRRISLHELPKLGSFCEWRCELELPALDSVDIEKCPLIGTFTMGSLSTPELEQLTFDHFSEKSEDLNSALQFRFKEYSEQKLDEESTSAEGTKEKSEIEEEP